MMRFSLALFAIIIMPAFSAAQQYENRGSNCLKDLHDWLVTNKVPAVGIGVIEKGKLQQIIMMGNLKNEDPAPFNTIFQMASLTKPVTTMVTLMLVSTGDWQLDEPLDKYWIDPDVINDPRHSKLTTRIILTHQTGFDNWRRENITKRLTFNFDPGTKVSYSGEGFEYLKNALEHKFGKTLERLADSLIFKPFNMFDTRLVWNDKIDESRYAVPHDKMGSALEIPKNSEASAADLLKSTVEDYCKFGIEVMKGTGLSKEVFSDMLRPQAVIDEDESFGLGWDITRELFNGEYAIMHSGHDYGTHTIIILLPMSQRGLVVLTNGENGDQVYEKVILDFLDVGREIVKIY